jgi:hypothetical protein
MKIDFSRITNENYKEIIEKCRPVIGKVARRYNLPILYIAAMNFRVLDDVYENIFTMRESQNPKDWIIMSEEELKKSVEEIQNQIWPPTFLHIMAFFRNKQTGRVIVDYLEHVL